MKKCWCGNQLLDEYSDDYYVCHACGTLIAKKEADHLLTTVRDEDRELYGSNYWTEVMVKESKVGNIEELIQIYFGGRVPYWLQYIVRYVPFQSSIAEIGCGLGQLSFALKSLGFQQTAYELSPGVCRFLKRKMGLQAVCGEFGCVNEIYDAILSFDLLEHLVNPVGFIKECRARLTGKRIFCCQTPCYTEDWTYEEMLSRKPEFVTHLIPKQHLYIFSQRSVTKLLTESGFPYIVFEPPAFQEHYDMFLFASPDPIVEESAQAIMDGFYATPNGILMKVLIDFFNRLNAEQTNE